MEELENINTVQNDENIKLQRDKLLLTDEICDLQAKVSSKETVYNVEVLHCQNTITFTRNGN